MAKRPLIAKIFCFAFDPNHLHIIGIPPTEGRCARHETREGMRWTRRFCWTGSTEADEQKRMVLAPRSWCQVGGKYPAGDGGKKARSPGRVRHKPYTIAWAVPGDVWCALLTRVPSTKQSCTRRYRAAPRARHPHA